MCVVTTLFSLPVSRPTLFRISHVYGGSATFMDAAVEVDHRTGTQKSSSKIERYNVDRADAGKLEGELKTGHARIKAWIAEKGHDIPLHITCGYTGGE